MRHRSPKAAQQALEEAKAEVILAGDTPIEKNCWDAAEAALDGQPRQYLADIISGKAEGPYRPTSGWRARG